MATPTATKVREAAHPAPKAKATATKWTTDLWTTALIDSLNVHLRATGQKLIPVTQNNIDNFERIMAAEVGGQSGGFLRDNNPLNVGTFCGAHGPLYGAEKTIAPYGPDPRCSGGAVYLNVFKTPLSGAQGTARYLQQYGGQLIKVLQQDAPTSLFAAASPWGSGDLGSAPLKETASATTTFTGPSGGGGSTGQAGPEAPAAKGKADSSLATQILAWVSSPHKGSKFPAQIQTRFDALSAADKAATLASVKAVLAKQRNLSLLAEIEAAGGGVKSGVASVTSDLSALPKLLGELGSAAFWKRIGIGAAGVVLIIGGIVVFLSSTKTAHAVEGKVV